MTDCKSCRYVFRHHIDVKEDAIYHKMKLLEKKTKKEVSCITFTESIDKYAIVWIESKEVRKTHATRLIRVLKAIARENAKPIIAEVVPTAIGFFEKNGFVPLKDDKDFVELAGLGLTLMGFQPKAI